MANHLVAAIDEDGAEAIVSGLVTGLSGSTSGSASGFSYSVAWEFFPGQFELVDANDIIRLREWDVHTDISLGWEYDLSELLPDFCVGGGCVDLGWFGEVCLPEICIDWPEIDVDFTLPTIVSEVSVDFSVAVEYDAGANQWVIKGAVNPLTLDIDVVDLADTIAQLFEDTLGDVVNDIPGIGPYLEQVISAILSALLDIFDDLGESLLTALSDSLGLHPLLAVGFELHRVDEVFEIVPAAGPEPAVTVRITDMDVDITHDKELVVSADIAVP